MQQLEERNTYTSTDIPHVCSNCGLVLNAEEILSVPSLKTSSNNSDVALTGYGSSRAELASFCCKNSPLLTANMIAGSLILHLLMQGDKFLPVPKYRGSFAFLTPNVMKWSTLPSLRNGVLATPAPHGGV
jgi:hypothetical protein